MKTAKPSESHQLAKVTEDRFEGPNAAVVAKAAVSTRSSFMRPSRTRRVRRQGLQRGSGYMRARRILSYEDALFSSKRDEVAELSSHEGVQVQWLPPITLNPALSWRSPFVAMCASRAKKRRRRHSSVLELSGPVATPAMSVLLAFYSSLSASTQHPCVSLASCTLSDSAAFADTPLVGPTGMMRVSPRLRSIQAPGAPLRFPMRRLLHPSEFARRHRRLETTRILQNGCKEEAALGLAERLSAGFSFLQTFPIGLSAVSESLENRFALDLRARKHSPASAPDARIIFWSGLRGSNSRQAVWKTAALPSELNPQMSAPDRTDVSLVRNEWSSKLRRPNGGSRLVAPDAIEILQNSARRA